METTTFEDVVELNVGGKLITTSLDTLRKETDSMLADKFSGRHVISKDKDGRYFIDCDGEVFTYIVDYLRTGKLPPQEKVLDVYELAKYFQIKPLVGELKIFYSVIYKNQIAKLRDRIERKEYGEVKQKTIDAIEDGKIGPKENKALHFFCKLGRCSGCIPNKDSFEILGDFSISINIFIDTKSTDLTEDMMALLAYELCELGFAKDALPKKGNTGPCMLCMRVQEINQIILLTQKQ
ncbi:BTB/POZ domain-containing protein KCTD14-like [Mercenaria mercenaria]|uniref:BTB/POZ domain-containing protein KCTD14-like n=1 Tax=Mercenaria mercenaria TaxID=6596 RepID=UPI00234F401E|nr:BTB/POZ domain-containing protein KCTD14-like [Mercenaria mercenaria]